MRIAIFSDIHGKILLPFKLVDAYQNETGKKIDLILQCGDVGAFPDLSVLDKATLRYAEEDPDELGFHDDFVREKEEIRSFLDRVDVKMVCVRGNHEDHDFLDRLEAENPDSDIFPVDAYGKVWFCKSGKPLSFEKNGEKISFLGIGRIGDPKNRDNKRYVQDYERREIRKALKKANGFDLLLTHDKATGNGGVGGMPEIRFSLDNAFFAYHFHGHTGEPFFERKDSNGKTVTCKIKELEFSKGGALEAGSMIVLEKKNGKLGEIQKVGQKVLSCATRFGWKYL
ncbi:hypothetical protein FUAX_34260 [Fulvitalea axinellae]|uniref:Calcineurin-like phosphoesterase domain-containing protein n=1 Tax=Fulvitalea axinellae TaxID=1182444 RepID=A0AAU9CFP3_9BACT|nr:hypothetical protein FUAX_34260 [Fulvitalea axinellae]